MTPGILYGIGVGPGDPDLLTLRAVRALQQVDVIFAASSTRNDYSVALSIATPHLAAGVEVVRLGFPMTRDDATLQAAWHTNTRTVVDTLRQGRNAAFLTLGDPLIYSTFGYLLRTLREVAPELPVEVIPGITSYQAAAARTATILCESGQNLLLLPGVNSAESLDEDLAVADNAVILKAYRNFPVIRQVLRDHGVNGEAVFASRLGMEGEVVAHGLENAPDAPHYLSLLLVPGKRP